MVGLEGVILTWEASSGAMLMVLGGLMPWGSSVEVSWMMGEVVVLWEMVLMVSLVVAVGSFGR